VKPGMTATASVVADHRDGVVSLPTSAVSTRGATATVTVRAKTGKETQVPITIGLRGDSSVEITSGLNAGDIVVIRTAISGGGTSTRGGVGGTGAGTGTATGGGGVAGLPVGG
jgi:macrolide-specific efflux system membrane fusion protein